MYSMKRKSLISATVLTILASAYAEMGSSAPAMDPPAKDATLMLVGSQEVPPVQTDATATSTIAVAEDMSVTGAVTTSGIAATAAHIHQGAVGVSGPVVVALVRTSDTQWSVPANIKLTTDQYNSYKAGELYVNVHSAAHKDGEIRMQLKP
jgi:CHRD domain